MRITKLLTALAVALLYFYTTGVQAQLTVSPAVTQGQVEALVNSLKSSQETVKISNITWSAYGSTSGETGSAIGGFSSVLPIVSDMKTGMVLSTGLISNVPGPNYYQSAGTSLGRAGDTDISLMIGAATRDAVVLEFDIIPSGNSLSLDYIFASEEYPEKVCAPVNDAFAVFISGPGIVGKKNIARVSDLEDVFVGINTVNNGPGNAPGVNTSYCPLNYALDYTDNPPGSTNTSLLQYDGYTLVSKAWIESLQACQQYHIKIVIADGGDGLYDSGLLLKAGSLESYDSFVAITASSTVICGTQTLRLNGPEGYATYQWKKNGIAISGATQAFYDAATAGTYTVEVKKAGCTVAVVSPGLAITAKDFQSGITTSAANLCVSPSGISLAAKHLTGTYKWSPGNQTTREITVTNPGTYSVEVEDNGCKVTYNKIIVGNTMTIRTDTVGMVNCYDGKDGFIHLSVIDKVSTFTYEWTKASDPFKSVLEDLCCLKAGLYTVKVTDADGCVKTKTEEVIQPAALTVIAEQVENTGGSVNATISGGTLPYTYSWTNESGMVVATTEDVENLSEGLYTLTVTDKHNCSKATSVTVTGGCNVSASTAVTPASCVSVSDGAVVLTVTNLPGTITYSWQGPGGYTATSRNIAGLKAGEYTYTAVNEHQCKATGTVTVGAPAFTALVTVLSNPKCFQSATGSASVSVAGGTPPYTYEWINASNSTISTDVATGAIVGAGNYKVLVTDHTGCVTRSNFTILEPEVLTVSLTPTDVSCYGLSNGNITANVTGGVAPYTYSWTGPSSYTSSAATLTGLAAGTYTLVLKDANNCSPQEGTSISADVNSPAEMTVSVTPGATKGQASASVSAGGVSPFSYLWSDGQTTAEVTGLKYSSTYTVTVTGQNGCSVTATYTPGYGCNVRIVTDQVSNMSCSDQDNGSIGITVNGVTSPVYSWTGPNGFTASTEDITNLANGAYTLTVTDANNCKESKTIMIQKPLALAATLSETQISCHNLNNGVINTEVSGGTPGVDGAPDLYQFSWKKDGSTFGTTKNLTGLSAGVYEATVTDANGCSTVVSKTIVNPDALSVSMVKSDITCYGNTDGKITSTPLGGTVPYSYAWTKQGGGFSSSAKDVTSLSAGIYNLTVTDARGCSVQTAATINAPASAMTLLLDSKTNATCASGRDGTAQITASGGYGSFTYAWTLFGKTIAGIGTLEDQAALKAGDYTVYATDAGGCVKSLAVQITAPTGPEITLSGAQNICAGQSVTLSSSQSGTGYKWFFNNLATAVATTATYTVNSEAQSGYYKLVVTKSSGCSDTSNAVQVTVNAKPSAAITASRTHFCQGDTVILSAINYPEATYAWKQGATTLTTSPAHILKVTQAGTYELDITTPLCLSTHGTAVLTSHNPFSVSASVTHVTCNAPESGAITVVASGQYGAVSWDWAHMEGSDNGASVSGLTDGYYKVTGIDNAGCQVAKYVTVLETDLNVQHTITNISCAGASTGSVTLTPSSTKSGSMGSCYAGIPVSPYICGDPSFVSLSGSSSVTIGAGQKYMVQSGDTYTGSITINNGGTLVVCGTISHTTAGQVITFNGGTLIINTSGHLLTSNTITQNGGSMINYGELKAATFSLAQRLECKNYGSMVASGSIVVSYLAVFENYSSVTGAGQLTTSGSSSVSGLPIQNYGTIQLSSITLSVGMILNNYCTITSSSLKLGNTSTLLNNYGTITISGTSELYGTITQQAGAKLETNNLRLYGTINGQGSSCSLVKINNNTTIYNGASFTGKTGVCPTNTIVNNNGTSAYGPEVTTNCSCVINASSVTCSVAWSGPGITSGTTGNTLSSLAAGTYTASITCGDCSKSISYTVSEPASLIANVDQVHKPACYGDANGGIDVSVTGGTPNTAPSVPYTYTWTGPNGFTSTSEDINNAEAGAYKLVVKDKNNCTYTIDTVRITQAGLLVASVECSGGPSCAGASNGSAYANISGGTAPYTYVWTKEGNATPLPQSTGRSISGLPAGTYQLLVKDYNNCEATASVVVPEATNDCVTNCTLSLTLEKQDASCPNAVDGLIYVTTSGESGTITYDWLHLSGTNDPSSLGYVAANTYTLKVTDSRGCVSQKEITIGSSYSTCEEPVVCNIQPVIVSRVDPSCPGSENGSVTIGATGATGSVTIDWMHIAGTENSLSLSELAPGVYRAVISDENGCTAPVMVMMYAKETPQLFTAATLVCPQNPVTLVSSYETGNTWSTGATTQEITITAPGTYTLTTLIPGCAEPVVNQVVIAAGNCNTVSAVCDPPLEETIEYVDRCADDELEIAYSNAYERYFQYIKDLKEDFRNRYISTCLDATETMTAEYDDNEHHYTLYYYDQAGNLVRTVPPKGVVPLDANSTEQAKIDFDNGTRTVYTEHTLPSTYTYNSLNQLIAQNIPDHDPMELTRIAQGSDGLNTSYTVSAVHFPGSTDKGFVLAYDANNDGKIYFTIDAGKTWSELSTVCTEDILDIEKINDNVLHAVGNKGTYIVSSDGGERWILKETGLAADLLKLHYFSYSLPLTDGVLIDKLGKVYQTTDGGDNWIQVSGDNSLYSLLLNNSATLTDVHYASNTTVYASAKNNTSGFLYKSVDGGYTWTSLTNIQSTSPIATISMPSSGVTVVTTGSYLLSSANNGVNWKITGGNVEYGNELTRFRSVTQGIRYSYMSSELLSTNDAGKSWSTALSNVQQAYVQEFPSQVAYASTYDGKIYKSVNGGFTPWTLVTSAPSSGVVTMAASPSGALIAVADNNGEIRCSPASASQSVVSWQRIFFASIPSTVKKLIIRDDQNGSFLLSDGSVYRFTSNTVTGGSTLANPHYGNTGFADLIAVGNTDNLLAYKVDGSLIYSTDGGLNWSMGTSLPGGGTQTFSSLAATISAGKIIATAGDMAGNLYRNDDLLGTGTWQNAITYLKPLPVTAIAVNSSGIGVATTAKDIYLRTVDGGASWTMKPYGGSVNLSLGATVTEVAQSSPVILIGASDGTIYASGDDGDTWAPDNIAVLSAPVLKIGINSTGRVFALHKNGKIQYKNINTTGWNHWTTISPNVVSDPLYDIAFSSTGNSIIVGGAGKVLMAENNSTLFTNVTNSDAPILYASEMTSGNIGYAAGKDGVVVKTKNGGQKWSELNSGTSKTLYALDFFNNDKGIVAGDGIIRITQNGGTDNFNASISTSPALSGHTLRYAHFLDEKNIFLAGNQGSTGIVFTSSDGGDTFTKSASTFGDPIYSVSFFSSTQGIMAGHSSSEIYTITRSGSSYTFAPVDISAYTGGKNILNLKMVEQKVWYVVGEGGLMLRTDDGGATWINLNNTGSTSNLSFIDTRTTNGGQITVGGSGGSLMYLTDERSRFTDKFWYDELGRLVASQNSKQNNYTPQKAYSYTLYDALGRITEVGELLTSHEILEVMNNTQASQVNYRKFSEEFLNKAGTVRREVTRTYYDVSKFTVPSLAQSELRNRVASITYQSGIGTDELAYDYATHYSYDVHGNVKALVQDNAKLAHDYSSFAGQRYKKIEYSYDLISGNVLQVSYQKGLDDQFYHKYEYDADNRITNVYTSRDGRLYEQDAKYFYYRHGPLARAEIGQDKVQAMDYAYTLQGWIKGVNSTLLKPSNDQGKDGATASGNLNRYVAADAAGYSLNYYTGDYKTIASISSANMFVASGAPSTISGVGQNLYNGNISSMATTIFGAPPAGNTQELTAQGYVPIPQLTAYKYDQLNRIKQLKAYKDVAMAGTNSWTNATNGNSYNERFAYDPNGNITTMSRRNSEGTVIDSLNYAYENKDNGYARNTNRLRAVIDDATDTNIGDIRKGQTYNATTPSQSNYDYDGIGNLVKDASEEIATIEWNVYGKVSKVLRTETSTKPDLEFLYDAGGNRIAKIVKPAASKSDANTWTTTYYVRDAQGNVLSTYEQEGANYKTQDFSLYGSSRLGTRGADATIVYQHQEAGLSNQVNPPAYEAGACDVEISNNGVLYSIKNGQRGVIPEGTTFSGKIIQEGGTLLVQGTYNAGTEFEKRYTYLGGEILVTGTLIGYDLKTTAPAMFYQHCDYNNGDVGYAIPLQVGTYHMPEIIAAGIPDNSLSSIRVSPGYKVTIYEHDFGGLSRSYTSDVACIATEDGTLGNIMNDQTSAIVIERVTTGLVEATCAPTGGTITNVLNNYGTVMLKRSNSSVGDKVNNYGLYNVDEIKLQGTAEFNNFGTVNSSFFEVTSSSSVVNQKPLSQLSTDVLNVYGTVAGDNQNFSTVTAGAVNIYPTASMTGLVKLCTGQLINNGTIASSVIQDCSFEIPGTVTRTTVKYELSAGLKQYEFSNHLGNVITTFSDRRIGVPDLSNPAIVDHYTAVILSSRDYYAFGWEMPNRGYKGSNDYRYGFNGKEDDKESGWQDYGMRMYNTRLSRFFSEDPLTKEYPWYTPYQFAGNKPIAAIDRDGEEESFINRYGNTVPASDHLYNGHPGYYSEHKVKAINQTQKLNHDRTKKFIPTPMPSGTGMGKSTDTRTDEERRIANTKAQNALVIEQMKLQNPTAHMFIIGSGAAGAFVLPEMAAYRLMEAGYIYRAMTIYNAPISTGLRIRMANAGFGMGSSMIGQYLNNVPAYGFGLGNFKGMDKADIGFNGMGSFYGGNIGLGFKVGAASLVDYKNGHLTSLFSGKDPVHVGIDVGFNFMNERFKTAMEFKSPVSYKSGLIHYDPASFAGSTVLGIGKGGVSNLYKAAYTAIKNESSQTPTE